MGNSVNLGSLYMKYRPKSFDDVVGNASVISSLKSKMAEEYPPHVFLFKGEYGTGKTTMAFILSDIIGAKGQDIIEVDAGTERGVDYADQLRSILQYSPIESLYKVVIIDEIQATSSKFQQSLLKTLENGCKDHVFFIICTTDPQKINKGILSRACKYNLETLPKDDMTILLKRIIRKEKRTKFITSKVIDTIVKISEGSPRSGINNLEIVISMDDEQSMLDILTSSCGVLLSDLCKALLASKKWPVVVDILDTLQEKNTAEDVRRGMMWYFRGVLRNTSEKTKLDCTFMIMNMMSEELRQTDGWPMMYKICCEILGCD